MPQSVIGHLHSIESFGALDGPGVRFVAFLQGCSLRCLYCHNPDTWSHSGGYPVASDELVKTILSYKSFIKNGGVTLSGGEPLLQPSFCEAVLRGCREHGLHTAIDTSGAVPLAQSKPAIDAADLLLLDIKDLEPEGAKALTGCDNANTMATLDYCEQTGKDVWIRHVLVPQYTMTDEKLRRLAAFLAGYSCIRRVELLPYHKLGDFKWQSLGLTLPLENVDVPTPEEVAHAKIIFKEAGLPC